MMPFKAMMLKGGGGGGVSVSYIGGTFHLTQTSANPTLAVPVGAASGDTVIVVLRGRADRTMSGFTGWTSHLSTVVRSTQPADTNNSRAYVLSRTLASETDFSFTHSANAAYGAALLVFRGGGVGTNTYADAISASITKASSASMLLAVGFANNTTSNPSDTFTAYTRRGYTTFLSGSNYFFTAYCETREAVSAGSTTATGTLPSSSNQNGVWLAEVG